MPHYWLTRDNRTPLAALYKVWPKHYGEEKKTRAEGNPRKLPDETIPNLEQIDGRWLGVATPIGVYEPEMWKEMYPRCKLKPGKTTYVFMEAHKITAVEMALDKPQKEEAK